MDADAVFLDTNVLLYASRPTAPQYAVARAKLAAFDLAGRRMWISTQVLREYFAVVSRPQGDDVAIDQLTILHDLDGFVARFEVAVETNAVYARLRALIEGVQLGGRQIHDANLVATMLEHGVGRLLTFNLRDFRRFAHVIELEDVQQRPRRLQTRKRPP